MDTLLGVAAGMAVLGTGFCLGWGYCAQYYRTRMLEVFKLQDAHEADTQRKLADLAARSELYTRQQWLTLFRELQERTHEMARRGAVREC